MNLLLDTHVLIWALENNPTLSAAARESICNAQNMVFVSAVTVWEIEIKKNLGKIEIPDNLQEEIELHRFTPLPINFEHAQLAGALSLHHRDPFDRMLVAQAITEKLTLVTRDQAIAAYKVNLLGA